MKVSFHGQSVVKVQTEQHEILFDPFITGNDTCDLDASSENPDVILLTHGHNDHVGDTIDIAKRTNCLVVAPNELAVYLESRGLKTHPMHIGARTRLILAKLNSHQPFMVQCLLMKMEIKSMAVCLVEFC
ncbi:metal-dependent hydrolase [Gracilibacillus halophilus YIM-C55.5]|uniref:Metal-dependent hydrolase n=1 Tax=Gracilibacillus halophilus YIM-C55.5 TaxID=1308866 RepID=N4WR97_9BACI|nr:metal-dependent hydrolase [Gracilibacillus halophilus YIM-C55.5]